MNRLLLATLAAAAAVSAAVALWPTGEAETAPGPAAAAPPPPSDAREEASTAARQVTFAPPAQALVAEGEAVIGPAAPPAPPVDRLPILVGVSGSDGRPVGYFSSNGQVYRARRGEKVEGWTVTALSRREARLVRGRKQLRVSLFAGRSGALSPAMSAPQRTFGPAQTVDPVLPGIGGAPRPAAPRKPSRPPPPLPKGSKGYWVGPPGSMPPGFTPLPKTKD